jgi:hypothetical protein
MCLAKSPAVDGTLFGLAVASIEYKSFFPKGMKI